MSSTLPARIRELAILRVAHRRTCAYEWSHHVRMAKDEGITDEQIAAVQRFGDGSADNFDTFDQAVLTGVDELDENIGVVRPDLGGAGRASQRPATHGFRLHGRLLQRCWPWPSTLSAYSSNTPPTAAKPNQER